MATDAASANSPQNPNDGEIVVTGLRTYKTARAAALAALDYYNPILIRTNTELMGAVYKIPFGSYIFLPPRHNGAAGNDNTPICAFCSAFYHTHAAFDPRFDNKNFSPEDRGFAGPYGVPIYLGTPSGAVKVYDPSNGYEGDRDARGNFHPQSTQLADEATARHCRGLLVGDCYGSTCSIKHGVLRNTEWGYLHDGGASRRKDSRSRGGSDIERCLWIEADLATDAA